MRSPKAAPAGRGEPKIARAERARLTGKSPGRPRQTWVSKLPTSQGWLWVVFTICHFFTLCTVDLILETARPRHSSLGAHKTHSRFRRRTQGHTGFPRPALPPPKDPAWTAHRTLLNRQNPTANASSVRPEKTPLNSGRTQSGSSEQNRENCAGANSRLRQKQLSPKRSQAI